LVLQFQTGADGEVVTGYTFEELRESFDGRDSFMSGHQILKVRKGRSHLTEDMLWVHDEKQRLAFLKKQFPCLEKAASLFSVNRVVRKGCSRKRQGRNFRTATWWSYVIVNHLHRKTTASETAQDWNELPDRKKKTANDVTSTASKIRLAVAGKRQDGRVRTHGKRGRKRKHRSEVVGG
jgi:hypothetical protein